MSLRDLASKAVMILEDGEIFTPEWKEEADKLANALRAALAEPQPEPVAWVSKHTLDRIKDFDGTIYANSGFDDAVPLYTHPPQRQPLTDLYNELLFAVGNKYPNETRHQTALRYIKQAETASEASIEKAHNIGGDK